MAELERQQKEIREAQKKDKDKQNWIDTDKRLFKETTDATNRLHEAVAVVEGEAFKQKETLVNEWNSTIDARAWMTGAVDASKIIIRRKKSLKAWLPNMLSFLADECLPNRRQPTCLTR